MNHIDDSMQRGSRVLFRIMLSGIFIVAGLNHLMKPEHIAGRLEGAPLGYLATSVAEPVTLVLLAGVALFIAGAALLAGLKTQLAAAALIALIVPITVTVQVGEMATLGPLFKNIGLTGALIYFVAHGADTWSVDSWWSRRVSAG